MINLFIPYLPVGNSPRSNQILKLLFIFTLSSKAEAGSAGEQPARDNLTLEVNAQIATLKGDSSSGGQRSVNSKAAVGTHVNTVIYCQGII